MYGSGSTRRGEMSAWLRRPTRHPSPRVTLVCFPHAGGGASRFYPWNTRLSPWVEVRAVQYPGHEERTGLPLCCDAAEIVGPVAEAIEAEVETDYALFGHSLGGLLAFEVTRALRDRGGRCPTHLFVSACRAPDAPDAPETHPLLRSQSDAELLQYVRDLGGLPDEVLQYPELVATLLPPIKAGLTIYQRFHYEPGAPLSCPITAMAGKEDRDVTSDQLRAWARHTTAPLSLLWLPGGHFFPWTADALVFEIIRETLARDGALAT